MSIKYFCNVCGDEVNEGNPNRAPDDIVKTFKAPNGTDVVVSITVGAKDQALRAGEICDDCTVLAMTSDMDDETLIKKRTKELLPSRMVE